MENFFFEDTFYGDLDSLLEYLDIDEDNVKDLPDDYSLGCKYSRLEPVFNFSADWVVEHIGDHRFSEEGEEWEKISKILSDNINFENINSLIPKLYYEDREGFKITKADIIEWLK